MFWNIVSTLTLPNVVFKLISSLVGQVKLRIPQTTLTILRWFHQLVADLLLVLPSKDKLEAVTIWIFHQEIVVSIF